MCHRGGIQARWHRAGHLHTGCPAYLGTDCVIRSPNKSGCYNVEVLTGVPAAIKGRTRLLPPDPLVSPVADRAVRPKSVRVLSGNAPGLSPCLGTSVSPCHVSLSKPRMPLAETLCVGPSAAPQLATRTSSKPSTLDGRSRSSSCLCRTLSSIRSMSSARPAFWTCARSMSPKNTALMPAPCFRASAR